MPTSEEIDAKLRQARELIADGKVEIGNPAYHVGENAVVVRAFPSGLEFSWSRPGVGFGAITFAVRNGRLRVDTETMADEFVMDVLRQALDEADRVS